MKKFRILFLAVLLCMVVSGCAGNPSKEGIEYLKEGKYKEAEQQFKEAIEKQKNVGDAYRGIGLVKWEQESYEEAAQAFEKALKNDADKTGTIYNLLGNCQMKLSNPEKAMSYYRLALTAEENSEKLVQEIKFNMIAAFEQQGDWESAKVKLDEYVKEYPKDEKAKKEAEFLETR